MSDKVLVAYGSKHGATAEIAEAIGRAIQEAGLTVDVLSADAVGSLSPYQAVVLGSAVYAGMWRKEAIQLLESQEEALAQVPVWIFSSGPTGEGDPVELLDGWRLPEAQQTVADRISPREITVFSSHARRARFVNIGKIFYGHKNGKSDKQQSKNSCSVFRSAIFDELPRKNTCNYDNPG